MSAFTLSVVLCNYNHAQFLPRSLNAIMAQTLKPFEVLIIDDGSTDNSCEIIDTFVAKYPEIRFHKNEKNCGVVYSANKALELTRGEYIYYAAADDELLPTFCEKMMEMFFHYPQAGLCFSDPSYFSEDKDGVQKEWVGQSNLLNTSTYLPKLDFLKLLKKRMFAVPGISTIVKKNALIEAGGFLPELMWSIDWFVSYVICFRYGACYIPRVMAKMRIASDTYTATGKNNSLVLQGVLNALLKQLRSSAYLDVKKYFVQSGVLINFRQPMFLVLIKSPVNWQFISYTYLKRVLHMMVKKVMRIFRIFSRS